MTKRWSLPSWGRRFLDGIVVIDGTGGGVVFAVVHGSHYPLSGGGVEGGSELRGGVVGGGGEALDGKHFGFRWCVRVWFCEMEEVDGAMVRACTAVRVGADEDVSAMNSKADAESRAALDSRVEVELVDPLVLLGVVVVDAGDTKSAWVF